MPDFPGDPPHKNSDSSCADGGAVRMSPEKLQELKSKFKQVLQQKGNSLGLPQTTVPQSTGLPPLPPTAKPPGKLPPTGFHNIPVARHISPEGQNVVGIDTHPYKISGLSKAQNSTKIRATLTREEGVGSKTSQRIRPVAMPNETTTSDRVCIQQVPMVLDMAHHILAQILDKIRNIGVKLDLSHYFNKTLQRLRHEAINAKQNGEPVYQSLFDLLQHKIYGMVLFQNDEGHWANIPINFSENILLQQQPCKIFHFLFRMITILFHDIQHKLGPQEQKNISLEIMNLLNSGSQFLKKGNRICSLQKLFQFARHSSFKKDAPCCSMAEIQEEPIPQEDFFAPQEEDTNNAVSTMPNAAVESAPPPVEEQQEPIFCGTLGYITIWQVFQILSLQHKSGCLIVDGQSVTKVYLQNGVVVYCYNQQNQINEDAFYQMLYEQTGRFMLVLDTPPESSMNQPIEVLLMEGSRRIDEFKRDHNNPQPPNPGL